MLNSTPISAHASAHTSRLSRALVPAIAICCGLAACVDDARPPVAGAPGELRADAPVPACVTPFGEPSIARTATTESARDGLLAPAASSVVSDAKSTLSDLDPLPPSDASTKPLATPTKAAPAPKMARSLREDELWKSVFPDFARWSVGANARTCTGAKILPDAPASAPTIAVTEGSTMFGGGADRMRVAWFPVSTSGDRTLGALALYRPRGPVAEIFAVGALDAIRARTKLGIERLGSDLLVTVTDEGCAKKTPGIGCETRTTVYAPRHGALVRLASYAVEKIVYVVGGEPGFTGRVAYHLEASVRFEKTAIRISELLSVRDDAGAELRRIQQERGYAPLGEGLVADGDPLVVAPPGK
jgi:hypothetical protein